MATAQDANSNSWLICSVGPHFCALPLARVQEIMRPLPAEPFPHAPHFVRGISIIRGEPVPVVEARSLFDTQAGEPQRFVTIKTGSRIVALGFDGVLGIRSIALDSSNALPALVRDAAGDTVSAIGTLDTDLLLFLQTTKLLSDWQLDVPAPERHAE